jgi:hypothetical protein
VAPAAAASATRIEQPLDDVRPLRHLGLLTPERSRDVRVLRKEQRVEAELLEEPRDLAHVRPLRGREEVDAELHRHDSPNRRKRAAGLATAWLPSLQPRLR